MVPPIRTNFIDHRTLLQHLEQAERYVAEGEKHLFRQEEIVLWLENHRLDTRQARAVLETLRDTVTLYHQHRELVLREFEEVGLSPMASP
jgi:hypothetical protein